MFRWFSLLVLGVSFLTVLAAEFSDDLARNTLYPLAAAAYGTSEQQQLCLDKHRPGAKVSLSVTVPCDSIESDTCTGFTFLDEQRRSIGLIFRGTSSDEQLQLEIQSTIGSKATPFSDGGSIGPYFNEAFEDLWSGGLGESLVNLSAAHPDYTLFITGHSLGASLAALGAVRVAERGIHPMKNIIFNTFGEPRTGDATFANLLDSLITGYRVVHNKDMIPHTPLNSMGYQHHATEVFYENDMATGDAYTVCEGQEDPNCSAKIVFGLNFDPDHFHYYGYHAMHYGRSGCTVKD